ncbi:MAG: segregation/condensation protein A [Candidatus Omnitrophota bacterium]|nr:MAG: segregation/condensation protein A [Candidatus Omnitrophota bacterium]
MKIRLDIFEGPLDLLLYLIKKNHLNVGDIVLTDVVEQYLQFLEFMKLLDINLASEYLVMAANLINLKSKMLLPKSETDEEEPQEDPRQELVRKLIEYEKFKKVADFLKTREIDRRKYFSRPAPASPKSETYLEASIFDLISAFQAALKEVPKDIFFQVMREEFTVEEKIHDITHLLLEKDKISLEEMISSGKNKIEVVVIFLAILELIKLREVVAVQEDFLGPILIARRQSVYSSV